MVVVKRATIVPAVVGDANVTEMLIVPISNRNVILASAKVPIAKAIATVAPVFIVIRSKSANDVKPLATVTPIVQTITCAKNTAWAALGVLQKHSAITPKPAAPTPNVKAASVCCAWDNLKAYAANTATQTTLVHLIASAKRLIEIIAMSLPAVIAINPTIPSVVSACSVATLTMIAKIL
jgi:hypothetical protein